MHDDDLVTGDAVTVAVRSGSFAMRAASAAIDIVATLLLAGGIALVVVNAVPADQATVTALLTVVAVGTIVVLPAVVEASTGGRSLGRLALGLRIVRDDGGAIGFRHAFVRALVGVLELYLTLGGIAAIVGLLSARTKRLGDLLAGTYAMRERIPQHRSYAAPVPESLLGWAAIADVARLPDPLARRIAGFLRQAGAMQPSSRAALATSLADEATAYVHPIPTAPPEQLLVAIAALRRQREATALAREDAVLARLQPVVTSSRSLPDRG